MAVPLRRYLLVGQLSRGEETPSHTPPAREVAVWSAAICGRCPRCNRGKLFQGALTVADTCDSCALDLRGHEKGDGPAFFAITIIGTLVCVLAVATELLYSPPYWLHALLWIPVSVVGTFLCLRWAKGMIVALQYKHRVDEFSHDD